MSGINGACNRPCKIGRAHDIECHNYIEIDLPCPVCGGEFGRHISGCIFSRTRSTDHLVWLKPGWCDTGTAGEPCRGCPDCKAGAAVDIFGEYTQPSEPESE